MIYYVATNGTPQGGGSKEKPYDLQTALNHPPQVKAKDEIHLLTGIYKGVFVSKLDGRIGNPFPESLVLTHITVRSAPSNWAVIDGYYTLELATDMGTERQKVTLKDASFLPDDSVVMIGGEKIRLIHKNGNSFTAYSRGVEGTPITVHKAGDLVLPAKEPLTVSGSNVIIRNLEVTDSRIPRRLTVSGSNAVSADARFTGIIVFAPESKIINCVVHDTMQGIFPSTPAINCEIYGNLLYNNGVEAPDRGHGHGIYTQNKEGRKVIAENIIFGNFGGFGIHCYGSSNASLDNFLFEGNVNLKGWWLIGGGGRADRMEVKDNFLYKDGMQLGYTNKDNGSAVVTGNYIYAKNTFTASYWKDLTLENNKFISNGVMAMLYQHPDLEAIKGYKIDKNDYLQDTPYQWVTNINPAPLPLTYPQLKWSQWQGLGFDVNSKYVVGKPKGIDIFYRKNKHEQGRANIIIYNYDLAPKVKLYMSKVGLKKGQKFEIRNGLDYSKILYRGTYNSQTLSVTMEKLKIAQPQGDTLKRNTEVSPEFGVLVVVPV